MANRVSLAWVCSLGHQTPSANVIGGRGTHGEVRTLVAEGCCLRQVCACPEASALGLERCRSVPCGEYAALVLVDTACSHPFAINQHLPDGGMCGICGVPWNETCGRGPSALSMALAWAYR